MDSKILKLYSQKYLLIKLNTMRKFFFSTAMILALVTTSSAKNKKNETNDFPKKNDKEIVIEKKLKSKKEVELCVTWAVGRVIIEDNAYDLSSIQAYERYQLWYDLCMAITSFEF